jgi:hypothetical protein
MDDLFSPDQDRSEYDALPDDKARAELFARKLEESAAHAREGTRSYRPYPPVNNKDIQQLLESSGLNGRNVSPEAAGEQLVGNFGAVDGIVRGFQEATAAQISAMTHDQREAYNKRKDMVGALKPLHAIFTDEAGRSEYGGMAPKAQAGLFNEKLNAAAGQAAEGAQKFSDPRTRISLADLRETTQPQDKRRTPVPRNPQAPERVVDAPERVAEASAGRRK